MLDMNWLKKMLPGLLALLLLTPSLSAQDIPIGSWRSHFPYRQCIGVVQNAEEVIFATPFNLYTVNKSDQSLNTLTEVSGLSATGVSSIAFNDSRQLLMIGYNDGILDLVDSRGIKGMLDIYNFQSAGSKAINHISFHDTVAYVSLSVGMSIINLNRYEVLQTVFTPSKVNAALYLDGYYYMALDNSSVYRISEQGNFLDFAAWTKLSGTTYQVANNYSCEAMLVYRDSLIADINDELHVWNGSVWQPYLVQGDADPAPRPAYFGADIKSLSMSYDKQNLLVTTGQSMVYDIQSNRRFSSHGQVNNAVGAIKDASNNYWLADLAKGGYKVEAGVTSMVNPNGPYSFTSSQMLYHEGNMYVAGGPTPSGANYAGLYIFDGVEWNNYNAEYTPALAGTHNYYTMAIHPSNDKLYIGTTGTGLISYDGTDFSVMNTQNSFLTSPFITGLTFDKFKQLWISNWGGGPPTWVLKEDQSAVGFSPAVSGSDLPNRIVIDNNDYKWTIKGSDLYVFDDGEDVDDVTDDRVIVVSGANSNLPNPTVNCMVLDLNGHVWVGTAEGIVIFRCTGRIFDNQCPGDNPIVVLDGFNEELLSYENITAMAVDGANRKWIGTRNGLFLLNAAGNEQLEHFTTDNSPLPSNIVTAIGIHANTGEIFVGTEEGIVSYRGEATAGKAIQPETVTIFPNPVRPEYEGAIAVNGLVENAQVKITDINGVLIHSGQALGGQFVWDGKDYTGRRPSSGVYLVFSTSENGQEKLVTKLAFVN